MQEPLFPLEPLKTGRGNGKANKLEPQDRSVHDWYRFVLSFPPHLVRDYIADFGLTDRHTLLDPFCGTGTTLVEARLNHIASVGTEANPFAHFVSSVKVDWDVNPEDLLAVARGVAQTVLSQLAKDGIDDDREFKGDPRSLLLRTLSPDENKLLLTNSISPVPLHKTLVLLDCLRQCKSETSYPHLLLALANALVFSISNLNFGPEVGVGTAKKDAPVIRAWLQVVQRMADSLQQVAGRNYPSVKTVLADARAVNEFLAPQSIDAVITSPPYPNEKDYTRTTRLESVILGFVTDKDSLRQVKKTLVRSNTRNVYKDDNDDEWLSQNSEIRRIADIIEQRRIELGKTSGFERLYGRVTRLYFGGMARHLAALRDVLRPGAQLAYVVGDQASYLRVMIRTGHLLGEIAQSLGYELVRIDLFRTRLATATKEQLREEVVVLRWPKR